MSGIFFSAFLWTTLLLGSCSPMGGKAESAPAFPDKVFAPYVDVLAWPTFSIEKLYQETGQKFFTLAFITSSGGCTPAWGGVIPLDQDWYMPQIDFIRGVGGQVIISFGGASGVELALSCTDVDQLRAAYQSVIDRYDLRWIDLDIEGTAVADQASVDRRNKAVRGLQQANPELKVAYCLPVLPQGLTAEGLQVLQNAAANGVRIDLVNVMAMDYGDGAAPEPEGNMGRYAIEAAAGARGQLQALGMNARIGVTPMIGQNDVATERFYPADAEQLLDWAQEEAQQSWVGLLAMWSCNRDNGSCPGGGAQGGCSGIAQDRAAFTRTFFPFSRDDGGILHGPMPWLHLLL